MKSTKSAQEPCSKGKSEEPAATVVSTAGSDEDIRARCAESVGGWCDLAPDQQTEVVALMRRFCSMRAGPSMHISGDTIHFAEGANPTLHNLRLATAMGSGSDDYTDVRVAELVSTSRASLGLPSPAKLRADLAFIQGGSATDTVQSTLLVQMSATHDAAMKALRLLGSAQSLETSKLYATLAPKLLNAFTRQAEVLAKLQRGGEQVVKHVHIDNRHGGQAVVTDTIANGGLPRKPGDQSHAAAAIGAGPAMLGYDPQGNGVPITGSEGEAAMQDAWRDESGRAEGE